MINRPEVSRQTGHETFLQIHDREQFTLQKRISLFFPIPHGRYSHIDYLFITQRDLSILEGPKIYIISTSDHALISLSLAPTDLPNRFYNWRRNSSLLTNPTIRTQTAEAITSYFANNSQEDVSPLLIWEAHKYVLRGDFIKWGSKRNKDNTN